MTCWFFYGRGGFNGFFFARPSLLCPDVVDNYRRYYVVYLLKLIGLALNFSEKVRNHAESPQPLDEFYATSLGLLSRSCRSSKVDVQGLCAFCARVCNALQDIEDIYELRHTGLDEGFVHGILKNLQQKHKVGGQQLKVFGSLVERVETGLDF